MFSCAIMPLFCSFYISNIVNILRHCFFTFVFSSHSKFDTICDRYEGECDKQFKKKKKIWNLTKERQKSVFKKIIEKKGKLYGEKKMKTISD